MKLSDLAMFNAVIRLVGFSILIVLAVIILKG